MNVALYGVITAQASSTIGSIHKIDLAEVVCCPLALALATMLSLAVGCVAGGGVALWAAGRVLRQPAFAGAVGAAAAPVLQPAPGGFVRPAREDRPEWVEPTGAVAARAPP